MSDATPVELHHVTDGPADGRIVVLGGSIGSSLAMWDPQVGPLAAAGYRVVRYDHRGHGGSPVRPGPATIPDLAADVVALLDRLGIARAHVVGLSLGGMTAMRLAAHAGDRVDRLVLCCTTATIPPREMWEERATTARTQGTEALADSTVERWLSEAYRTAHPDRAARIRAMIAATSGEGYASCAEAIRDMDQRADLPRITAPTLVIAGADDPSMPLAEHLEPLAAAIPGARLATVAAQHLASEERAGEVTALILEHLAGAREAGA